MNNPFRLKGTPVASNAFMPPPTTMTGETVDPWNTSLPTGGTNTSSMLKGGLKKASDFISANKNTIGYALGGAAKAVMGARQDTPAAQLGGLGMQLNQQQAFKSTTAKMLAGTDLSEIPEAAILAPEQIGEIATQARAVETLRFEKEKHAKEIELKEKDLSLRGKQVDQGVKESDAQIGLINTQAKDLEARMKTYVSPIVLKYMDMSFDWAKLNQEHLNKLKELDKEGAIRESVAKISAGGNEAAARAFVTTLGNALQAGSENPLADTVTAYNTGAAAFGWTPIDVPKVETPTGAEPTKPLSEQDYYDKFSNKNKSPWRTEEVSVPTTVPGVIGASIVPSKDKVLKSQHPIYGKRLDEGFGTTKEKPLFVRSIEDVKDAPDGLFVTGGVTDELGNLRVMVKRGGKLVPAN